MFDSIPVKYSSWSREKNLDGIIKGTGYLCSCADCNHSKCLNAYEFERHACAKTKHPNNRIYFENGKTIHAVVEELKNTPQDMLFDAIQNVTGSQVNKKNFRVWIASFQAASVTFSMLRFDPWIASLVVNYRVEFGHIWILNFWMFTGAVVAIVVERENSEAWSIHFDFKLLAAVYGALLSGAVYYVMGLVVTKKGPVFYSVFNPLATLLVAILGSFFLAEQL